MLGAALALAASACTKDDKGLEAHLKSIDSQLKDIKGDLAELKKGGIARGAAGAAARPTRPPGPDAQAVYAAPIEGAAFLGAPNAKVTIVEGFDFA